MNYDLTIHCHTIDQLPDIVHRVYDFGKIFKVWLLKGEMGAGKTTFVYRLLDMMGTRDHVSSPSYSIMHEYITSKKDKIYHFDFFRVESVAEIFDTGIDEYLSSGHHCLIEWPE